MALYFENCVAEDWLQYGVEGWWRIFGGIEKGALDKPLVNSGCGTYLLDWWVSILITMGGLRVDRTWRGFRMLGIGGKKTMGG